MQESNQPSYRLARNIKSWAEEDRPREKLILKGKHVLSDAELIAILIGSGTPSISAVDLAKEILASVDHKLHALAQLSLKDLQKFKGIGEAKAISIVSALELGRRRKEQDPPKSVQIQGSEDVYDLMKPDLLDLPHEEFWIILLKRNNRVIRKKQISIGGISGTVADPKKIFRVAVEESASGMILVHNHPSGNLKPSQADHEMTDRLVAGGRFLDLPVLDHLIFCNDGYFSFADNGLIR